MPIFATLVAAAINGLTSFYALALTYQQAIAWARRTFILALGLALCVAVLGCIHSLLAGIASAVSGLPARFAMGLGMVIPSNAAVVLACMGSVWLACVVYRLKLEGLRW